MYTKMCDCSEIQDEWTQDTIRWGDFYWHDNQILPVMNILAILEIKKDNEKIIWLPLQKQLQKIYHKEFIAPVVLIYFLSKWTNSLEVKYMNHLRTMEQLWLAFVMDNLYQKKWNGEEWHVSS